MADGVELDPSHMGEACPLIKPDLYSFGFVINGFFMKLSMNNNMWIINECRELFLVDLPSCSIVSAADFLSKLKCSNNALLIMFY